MKNLIALFTLLVLGSALSADELVLKDGKIVTWETLRDLGDSYEIETPDGVKLEIRKDQILKVVHKDRARVQKDKAAEVLAGATFTWDKGRKLQQYDLLASMDPKKDTIRGNWKLTGGVLQNVLGEGWSGIDSSYVPPPEYDITFTVERKSGGECFYVALPASGTRFALVVDSNVGGWCGPLHHKGKQANDNKLGVKGKLLEVGKPKTFKVMIRPTGFAVQVDGKDLFAWKGDWKEMSLPDDDYWGLSKKNVIHFGATIAEFKVAKAVVTFPKE